MTTSRRWGLAGFGLAVVVLGLVFPRAWYDALPWDPVLARPPIKGVTLFQATLLLEGTVLAILGWIGWRGVWGSVVSAPAEAPGTRLDLSPRAAMVVLAGITALALILRLINLDADLWLDEIAPIARYRQLAPFEVLTTYLSANNHLLNTLLVKWTTGGFGEREWAVRLPALLFGVATVPVLYWLARLAASRLESLGAALLLALSYHHIFFSQNGRGYTAYLFFSLAATGLLVRGLRRDRPAAWALYAVTMVANFAALLHSVFVFGAHVLVGGWSVWMRRRRGEPSSPLVRRLLLVFGATALLGFQLYATMLPQAYVVLSAMYQKAESGFPILSGGFLADFVSGLLEGFGATLLLLVPFLLIAAYGFLVLLKREWLVGAALALPILLTVGVLAGRGLTASPRFFLLGLPLADLAVVLGVGGVIRVGLARIPHTRLGHGEWLAAGAVAILAMASLAALPRYYATPKQSYRAAVEYVAAHRAPGDVVVLIHTVEHGFRFYAARAGLQEGRDYVALRSVAVLDRIVREHGAGHTLLVTTFRRALLMEFPELDARVEAGWAPAMEFPAAIHDGEITIWTARPP